MTVRRLVVTTEPVASSSFDRTRLPDDIAPPADHVDSLGLGSACTLTPAFTTLQDGQGLPHLNAEELTTISDAEIILVNQQPLDFHAHHFNTASNCTARICVRWQVQMR